MEQYVVVGNVVDFDYKKEAQEITKGKSFEDLTETEKDKLLELVCKLFGILN